MNTPIVTELSRLSAHPGRVAVDEPARHRTDAPAIRVRRGPELAIARVDVERHVVAA
jgi:hypothetical protein